MSTDNSKILDKIKKCLALAASANEHEAAAALRQAQKLMEAHGVTDEDVLASQASEIGAKAGAVAASAGLKGVKATCTAGRRQAVQALLAKAVPPRRLARVVSYEEGPERTEIYTIEAEVA